VSHEFRTPISRLRFRHELALGAPDAAKKDVQLHAMIDSIDQLDDLARELLEYARLECETPKIDEVPIDVASWLAELTEDAREIARVGHRTVDISGECGCANIDGDYRYLTRAAGNLLRNAIRSAKSTIKVSVKRVNGRQSVMVEDDGPGIPVAERLRVFEPFARLDASRGRDLGGFGIGLAIVKQVARWHGGTVEIGDSVLGGASVTMTW
ncbi:MAG: ATP-binding protein, partial [Betaproteobacteria bacterium]|nr:ATP-binding protein [Betaproteobacteria bacterium]